MGPPIVMDAGLVEPEKDPAPVPPQLVKLYPVAGLAVIEIFVPLFFQPLLGLTVPPVPALIVK